MMEESKPRNKQMVRGESYPGVAQKVMKDWHEAGGPLQRCELSVEAEERQISCPVPTHGC